MKITRHLKLDSFTRGSVLSRYIVTYATILFLPCLIFGLFLFNRATSQIRQNALDSQQYNADQLSSSLSSEFNDLIPIITQITTNRTVFWPSLWKEDRYNRTAVSLELQKLKQFSPLLEDCILIYKQHDTVFTSTTHDSTEAFFRRFCIDEGKLSEILNTVNTRTLLSTVVNDTTSNKEYRALLYVVPFNMEKIKSNDMVMVFVLPSGLLDQWTRRYLGSQDYRLYLFDKNDELLLSYGSYSDDTYPQVADFHSGISTQRQIFIGTKAVSLFKLSVKLPGAYAVLETPWEGTVLQLVEFRKIFYITGAVTVVLGFLLVILFSYYNYSPLKRILASLKRQAPALMPAGMKNEYNQLDSAVNAALTRNKSLEEHINRQTKAFYLEILSGLLTGAVQYDKIDKTFNVCASLPGPYYCVLALPRPWEPDSAQQRETPMPCAHAVVDIPSYRCTAVILSLEDNGAPYREARAEDLYGLFAGESPLCMGASTVRGHIGELNQCMIEAILALKFVEDQKASGIQYYKETLGKKYLLDLMPETVLHSFTQSLKCGNQDKCIGIFDGMMDMIETCRNPIVSQIQCYDIANTVLRIIGDIAVDGIAVEIDFLELYRDIESFRNRMRLILAEVCRCVSRNRDSQDRDPFAALLKYVNEHCLEYDLSLEKLASDYSLSVSMVSKLFKLHTGTGFKEYLVKKRLDAARHLLCSTTMPVHEITMAVGYTNESHFIKRFKVSDGMTPAQYRKRYGHVT